VRRALAGLDPFTGERPAPALPARMTGRGWRLDPVHRVEVGRAAGWYWRCPRRSCAGWGGPFDYEYQAHGDGACHAERHPRRKR
jgi:hypothetical protein